MPDPFQNGSGQGGGPEDPLAEIREVVESVRRRISGGGGGGGGGPASPGGGLGSVGFWGAGIIALGLYLASGIFIVSPDQRGVVLRFGRVVREVGPGPNYRLPWPIEQVLTPSVTQVRKEEFGFRTIDPGPPARYRDVPPEALMLTGDGNIVKLQFTVQYKVNEEPGAALDFLFRVREPRMTVRSASEAAMRQVIGNRKIDEALTEGREEVQAETQEVLQGILDGYEVGLSVLTVKLQDVAPPDEVSDAFKDVISAEQDKERMINEARGYANDVVPKARGRAARLVNEADAYRLSKIEEARGSSERFLALLKEYEKAKDVTRLRIYLETMEEVLPRVNKILIDEKTGSSPVPYLPLDRLGRNAAGKGAE